MTPWQPHRMREEALAKAEALIAATSDATEARFSLACLLVELGRTEEAKTAYIELLKREPRHFGALNNLGNLLYAQGFRKSACTLYMEAVHQYPDNPKGYVNLANLLAADNQTALARKHFEQALALDPDHIEAHRGLAYILTELRDEERAVFHRQKAFAGRPLLVLPYTGTGAPITVLLLTSASGGMIPMRQHFDEQLFLTNVLFVEFYDPAIPLPPHQFVFNAIGDADLCKEALEAALKIVSLTTAPVINPPSAVLLTGRADNARRLSHLPDVIAPKIALLPRSVLEKSDAAALLAKEGFTFPLLLRAPGFHTGRFFARVDSAEALAANLTDMPGDALLVIQYMDTRGADGKIRKYRVMMIDGVLYPLHAAISHDWKVHYFSAEMADNPEHRAEDAAFLEDMPQVLGTKAMEALAEICKTLGLGYCGIDFGLSQDGKIILFEANATMVVYPPDKEAKWDYRRPAVQRILDAIRNLLVQYAPTAP